MNHWFYWTAIDTVQPSWIIALHSDSLEKELTANAFVMTVGFVRKVLFSTNSVPVTTLLWVHSLVVQFLKIFDNLGQTEASLDKSEEVSPREKNTTKAGKSNRKHRSKSKKMILDFVPGTKTNNL